MRDHPLIAPHEASTKVFRAHVHTQHRLRVDRRRARAPLMRKCLRAVRIGVCAYQLHVGMRPFCGQHFLGGESRVLVHINGDDAAAQPFWDAFEAARMGDTSSLQAVAEQEAQQLKAGDRALFLWPFETSEGARSLDSLQATLDSLAAAEGLVVGSSCVSLLTQSVFARTLRVGPVWRRRAAARAKLRPAPAAAAPVLHGTLQRGSVARLPHTVSQRRRGHSQSGVALSRRIRALLRLLLAPPRVSHRPLQHARYSGLLRLRLHPAREAR